MIPDEGICIISSRHKGIKCVIAKWPRGDDGSLRVFHRYRLRHVVSNFNKHFNDSSLKAMALKVGYATQEAKFESIMQTIKDVEINALRRIDLSDEKLERFVPYTYLMSEDLDKWTQSHDGGRRYGAMITNISECFNGVLKGAHGLPIVAMVEFTCCKLVAYFHDRHKEITSNLSQGNVWSDYAMGIYAKNVHKVLGHTMRDVRTYVNHVRNICQYRIG